MLPIAPPCLPRGHVDRHQSCVTALAGNYRAMLAKLVEAAVHEGWSRREVLTAIRALRDAADMVT